MAEEKSCKCNDKNRGKTVGNGACGGIYGLAFLGALVYFIQHATSFTQGIIGFLKALVWPAVLIYKVFELLKM